jgi:hypothetical protein
LDELFLSETLTGQVIELKLPPTMHNESSDLQLTYLRRLRRLLRLRLHHQEELNDEGLWLLDRSIFATYRDCLDSGASFAADEILRTSSLGSLP